MRISDLYIGRQVLKGTLYAVIVLGVVLVFGNLYREIQTLLVDKRLPPGMVLRFVIGVLPMSLIYTIPWGFLSAVLLVFGRLSVNHEITSFRVAGLGLVRLSAPVFVIGGALSLLSLWLNLNVVPFARDSTTKLIYEQAARDPASLLKPGITQIFKGDSSEVQKLLVEGRDGEWVTGFHFYVLPGKNAPDVRPTYVHAKRAAITVDRQKSQLRIKLEDAFSESYDENGEIRVALAGRAEPLLINAKDAGTPSMKPNAMSNDRIRYELATNRNLSDTKKAKLRAELASRYSFSMACLAFSFIAVPLGLQTRRRDTSRGLVLSLVIGTGYFLTTILADQVDDGVASMAVLWAPNVACVALGIYLFRRARFR